ncbi:MAG: ethanolamine ammonia-lyase reactivating factor EutA [Propionibacteriaceae bacterium]|jgi:ethanolamine utilization protein EutA|nr:ethanolamine ammonia-lyase reactivating factor EutA [Propionibacteriaceae bacterium]
MSHNSGRDVLLSVGIDIGTSTTQVIFSHITIQDMSSGFSVPRFEIIDKQIVYLGGIHTTPLLSPSRIDMAAVRDIVAGEYDLAGVDRTTIGTGAVVITGETARKENANDVVHHLSDFAGDFVVAAAGPELESVIAGRGAGADVFSKDHSTTVVNYDVGGGTSNLAMFDRGRLVAVTCLDIGGRLIRVDRDRETVSYIAPKIKELCLAEGIRLREGDRADVPTLRRVCTAMTRLLEMSLGLTPKSPFFPRIRTEEDKDIVLPGIPSHICVSGGVADQIYRDQPEPDVFRYGDIGILLGQSIRESQAIARIARIVPNQTIRATVVGAGTHIAEISGSTIEYDESLLPVKNVPILKLNPAEEASPTAMCAAIGEKLEWFRLDGELQLVAIAFTGPRSPSFKQVGQLAQAIMEGAAPLLAAGFPLIIISENDLAKVLGQAVRAALPGQRGFICIDAVSVASGDYVDIGTPTAKGRVLPVVVKTLLFR